MAVRGRVGSALAAKLFRGLGDPSRLAILQALRARPLNVSQVMAATGLSQSGASTHLSCLWCCGLVSKSQRGRFVYYRVRSRSVHRLLADAEALLRLVGGHVDACERYEAEGNGALRRRARGRRWA